MNLSFSRELLDVATATDYLSVKPGCVRRLVRERCVAFHKIGKHVRFDVRDWTASSPRAGSRSAAK